MCYELRFSVALQNESNACLASLRLPRLAPPWKLSGEYPDYSIYDGHCACDIVKDSKGFELLSGFVACCLAGKNVKRIDLIWNWMSERPSNPPRELLGIDEFSLACKEMTLLENKLYRIVDRTKWLR